MFEPMGPAGTLTRLANITANTVIIPRNSAQSRSATATCLDTTTKTFPWRQLSVVSVLLSCEATIH
jgi:hypothetical protein